MYEIDLFPNDRNVEYEFIQYGEIRNQSAPIGDLLSRLWGHFGEPQSILFEGFIYNIKYKNTGLSFIASFGASGPVYLGEQQNVEKLEPIVESFEKFLDTSPNVDCEIEIDTDFGIYLCGASNGIPYDKEKNSEV